MIAKPHIYYFTGTWRVQCCYWRDTLDIAALDFTHNRNWRKRQEASNV